MDQNQKALPPKLPQAHTPADRMTCCKLVIVHQLLTLSVKLKGKDIIQLFVSILKVNNEVNNEKPFL